MEFDDLSNRVIGCAIEVHRHLGPGLFESAYEQCLAHEERRENPGHSRSPTVDLYEIGGDKDWPADEIQRNKTKRGHQTFRTLISFVLYCPSW
jgi:hypothetical protein